MGRDEDDQSVVAVGILYVWEIALVLSASGCPKKKTASGRGRRHDAVPHVVRRRVCHVNM
jgi:hypothetical protein